MTDTVDLAGMARSAGYRHVRRVDDQALLPAAVDQLLGVSGPAFLLLKVAPVSVGELPPRVPRGPEVIADRFRQALNASAGEPA